MKIFSTIFLIFSATLVRLLPFRAPNLEPILAMQMPIAKKYGNLFAMGLGAGSIVLFDLITQTLGMWTIFTAVAYALVGVGAVYFFKKFEANRKNYVIFAVIGTIFYDALTGLTVGPIFFSQNFYTAIVGQVPFTILHLAGNISFAFFLSPIVDRALEKSKKLDFTIISNIINNSFKRI